MAYEDIYWVRLQRLVNATRGSDLEFLALAEYGNSLADSARVLESLAADPSVKIDFVLYQFNLNDITPYGRVELHDTGTQDAMRPSFFALWRYEYLNHSVFLRVGQHYAGMAVRRRTGSCEERGLDALGPYTWTYGSARYKDEAETYWREFEAALRDLKRASDGIEAQFVIFVSPLVFDVDRTGRHPHFNHLRLDFSCATIVPRERLGGIAGSLGIPLVDPAPYLREEFERRTAEESFTPFFFPADTNHFNQVAAGYIAEHLAGALLPLLGPH